MAERYRVVVMRSNGWKLPFNVALGIHILVLVGAVYLPAIFKSKPKFADVYSVSLVNIAEPEPAPPVKDPGPPKVAKQSPPPPVAPPKIKKEVTPVEETPKVVEKVEKPEPVKEEPEAETPAPPKAVSLKPLKQKKVKEVKEETPPKKPEMDRREIQKLAEALKEEEILAEKARLAREALEQERKLLAKSLKASEAIQASSSSAADRQSSASAASSNNSASTLAEAMYYSAIKSHLLNFWLVPEYMQKDLSAVIAITISQNGEVLSWEFENKSGDKAYDQFVSKTIEAAKPFPPIPPAMKTQRVDLGLRFTPGNIQ